MAYDEELAERVRAAIGGSGTDHDEIKMFGGLAFMVNTHMAVGIVRDELMIKVGKEKVDEAVERGASQMTMGERVMGGMVTVPSLVVEDEDALRSWVDPAVDAALALPPKASKKPKKS